MNPNKALLTDLYQLTMAQGYWKLGLHNRIAAFELFFRENPFNGGYAISCGLEQVIEYLNHFKFDKEDINYLATIKGRDGESLFQNDFLRALLNMKLEIDLLAIEEGVLVFPKEPLVRVMGPLWQCQILETALLNLINFPTLIATKASRVCFAADGSRVVEFGLRRAQGPNGALTASRAAFIGGVAATSNVLAGQIFDIPVVGTHAHSWVMAFENDQEAFEAYAKVMPNNCIFLVDTYKSILGIEQAIQVGLKLKEKGHQMLGIRLDSGNLSKLSIEARMLLDKAGLNNVQIMASSDLDEYTIESLKKAGAKIDVWGVGTRLVTAFDQPALGGVYKLVGLQMDNNYWQYKLKRSDDVKKQTLPGIHNVRRIEENGFYSKDIIYNIFGQLENLPKGPDLLQPIFKAGECIYQTPSLIQIKERTQKELKKCSESIRQLKPKETYNVELSESIT